MNASQNPIVITPTALTHIAAQLAHTQSRYLRLGLKQSGCNGFMYTLDFLEAPDQGDLCFEFDQNVNVCVAGAEQDMILGTTVDLITEGLNSAMVFKNPNATSYCGCGESFAVGGAGDGAISTDGNAAADLATNAAER